MKKMLKLAAVLVALFAMTNFIACSDGGSSSSSGGGTNDVTSNDGGSTTNLNGHVGKYYTMYYGEKLKSCIYFESATSGTIWYYNDDFTALYKKSFTCTAAKYEYYMKRLDITWDGYSSPVEAILQDDDDYLQVKVNFIDDKEPSDYSADTKPDVLN